MAFLLDIIVDYLGVCLGGSMGHDQYPALELVLGAQRPPATNFLCSLPQTARRPSRIGALVCRMSILTRQTHTTAVQVVPQRAKQVDVTESRKGFHLPSGVSFFHHVCMCLKLCYDLRCCSNLSRWLKVCRTPNTQVARRSHVSSRNLGGFISAKTVHHQRTERCLCGLCLTVLDMRSLQHQGHVVFVSPELYDVCLASSAAFDIFS